MTIDERTLALRVLWLEDDLHLRKAFGFIADDLGASVEMVASWRQAEQRLAEDTYDWIVCDYRVDGRPSDAFVERLVTAGHRVVVLTGDASRVPRELPVPVFEKPVRLEGLLGALVRLEDGTRSTPRSSRSGS